MKRIILMIMTAAMLVSCGAAGKTGKTGKIKTTSMPGSELVATPVPGAIRAWGMGISNNQMTAQKVAAASARAQLSSTLESVVSTTVEDYCVVLTEGEIARSKQFLNEKTKIVSQQQLNLSRPIFNQWERPDANGMWRCYVVYEISSKDYTNSLAKTVNESQGETNVGFDSNVFNELFLKNIASGK